MWLSLGCFLFLVLWVWLLVMVFFGSDLTELDLIARQIVGILSFLIAMNFLVDFLFDIKTAEERE